MLVNSLPDSSHVSEILLIVKAGVSNERRKPNEKVPYLENKPVLVLEIFIFFVITCDGVLVATSLKAEEYFNEVCGLCFGLSAGLRAASLDLGRL